MKNARTVLALAVSIALVYVVSGCATLQRGPSDEELLCELLNTYKTSLEEGDAESLIALYSKNYESRRGGGYEETVERMREWVPRLAERDVEIGIDDAEISIEGDTARLGPIAFESPRGMRRSALIVTKEDGVWCITGRERIREEEE